ncbi:hypothetical protein PENTCL1PPCAC_29259 [Pristionchus entomophagus]|uniref:Uncharacterized protein n=1 Tax=Pristionchus entomophagus TaxID=358040 RepID=A0AAV5UJ55_9BILA|nr:hypothetical protein PENTCL1PPCAC_29259 [Pristionchus entomophagus]
MQAAPDANAGQPQVPPLRVQLRPPAPQQQQPLQMQPHFQPMPQPVVQQQRQQHQNDLQQHLQDLHQQIMFRRMMPHQPPPGPVIPMGVQQPPPLPPRPVPPPPLQANPAVPPPAARQPNRIDEGVVNMPDGRLAVWVCSTLTASLWKCLPISDTSATHLLAMRCASVFSRLVPTPSLLLREHISHRSVRLDQRK